MLFLPQSFSLTICTRFGSRTDAGAFLDLPFIAAALHGMAAWSLDARSSPSAVTGFAFERERLDLGSVLPLTGDGLGGRFRFGFSGLGVVGVSVFTVFGVSATLFDLVTVLAVDAARGVAADRGTNRASLGTT